MNIFLRTVGICALVIPNLALAKAFEEMFPDIPVYEEEAANEILREFDYQQGEIKLPAAKSVLNIPEGYYFLGPEDASMVLEILWGNPEAETMGMIFPVEYTPYDYEAWGVELTWDPIGYVSDEDAADIDYGDLLSTMKSDVRADSRWREENGYEPIELVGWAVEPSYDQETRKLHWAQEIAFGDSDVNTLNYKLRALGRKGVLQLNFVASMEQLTLIEAALPDVAAMTAFAEGSRYIDFDPSIDTIAAVGIGGLIAGKVVAKTGLFIVLLLFLKKFAVILILPVMWLVRKIKGGGGNV